MLVLLSPAKSLDESSPLRTPRCTQPRLLDQSEALIEIMRTYSVADLRKLMKISEELAELNVERYRDFETPFNEHNARPAIAMFTGDVYQGMDAYHRFQADDYEQAQRVLRILSGLYGLLRPLDLMQAYRLEMGTKVPSRRGEDLYEWWADRITSLIREDLDESPGEKCVINLASNEYFSAVQPHDLPCVISPRFEDLSSKGERKIISFHAKRARGMMAGWIVREKIDTPDQLVHFDESGYRYDPEVSTEEVPVFFRGKK